jgi:hypothetical protein
MGAVIPLEHPTRKKVHKDFSKIETVAFMTASCMSGTRLTIDFPGDLL